MDTLTFLFAAIARDHELPFPYAAYPCRAICTILHARPQSIHPHFLSGICGIKVIAHVASGNIYPDEERRPQSRAATATATETARWAMLPYHLPGVAGTKHLPPVIGAPMGPAKTSPKCSALHGAGRLCETDQYMPSKRYVVIDDGTHTVALEKNRM